MSAAYFSILLATYNRAALLPRALDSVQAQTWMDWELVVVDDGSTDETAALVRERAAADGRIRLHSQARVGVAQARNAGARLARGKVLTFLDSDDAYTPSHLAVRHAILEADPGIDLLHGGYTIIGDAYVPDKHDPSRRIHLDECIVDPTFFILRHRFWLLGGFPDLPYAAGSAFFEQAEAAGFRIRRVEERTYLYHRMLPDSICAQQSVSACTSEQRDNDDTKEGGTDD
jgi:glycosyltransferase involved in cell wall biosynthesis